MCKRPKMTKKKKKEKKKERKRVKEDDLLGVVASSGTGRHALGTLDYEAIGECQPSFH